MASKDLKDIINSEYINDFGDIVDFRDIIDLMASMDFKDTKDSNYTIDFKDFIRKMKPALATLYMCQYG